MTKNIPRVLLGLALSLVTAGCNTPSNAAPGQASASQVAATPAAAKVTKVVFVGKEHACECTQKRVEGCWAALQKALGTPPKLPVVRLQIDTDQAKVEPYQRQKPMMAVPAIYFVDGKENVLDLLQGEVNEPQIAEVLGR